MERIYVYADIVGIGLFKPFAAVISVQLGIGIVVFDCRGTCTALELCGIGVHGKQVDKRSLFGIRLVIIVNHRFQCGHMVSTRLVHDVTSHKGGMMSKLGGSCGRIPCGNVGIRHLNGVYRVQVYRNTEFVGIVEHSGA